MSKQMPEINPLYTTGKFSMTEEELEKIEDPKKLIEEMERVEKANAAIASIRPELKEDRDAVMENYASSIQSLEVEISALDMLATEILSSPDSVQMSIYDAKVADIANQIDSLDKIYKNDGFTELDERFEKVKIRFGEINILDTQKMRQQLG